MTLSKSTNRAEVQATPNYKALCQIFSAATAVSVLGALICLMVEDFSKRSYQWQYAANLQWANLHIFGPVLLGVFAGYCLFFEVSIYYQYGLVTLCCLLDEFSPHLEYRKQYDKSTFYLRAARKLALALFVVSASCYCTVAQYTHKESQDWELAKDQVNSAQSKPLTASGNEPKTKQTSGTILQRASADRDCYRLTQTPKNYWKCAAECSILLPYLLPTRDRKFQLYFTVKIICVIILRVVNVLISRQVGIITDSLTSLRPLQDCLPWKAILMWFVLRWLNSRIGVEIFSSIASQAIQNTTYKYLMTAAFDHTMGLSMSYHENEDYQDITASLRSVSTLSRLVDTWLYDVIPDLLDLAVAYVYLYISLDPRLTVITLIASLGYILINLKLQQWSKQHREKFSKDRDLQEHGLYRAIEGWTTVWHFSRFEFESSSFNRAIERKHDSRTSYDNFQTLQHVSTDSVLQSAFAGCVMILASQVGRNELQVGSLMSFIIHWDSITFPLRSMNMHYKYLWDDLRDIHRLLHLLQKQPTVTQKTSARALPDKPGEVTFQRVHFAYDKRKTILSDISIAAPAGSVVALVGETGSGKSTLFKLLSRFYDVTGGRIMIGGVDIRDVTLPSLRAAVGVVPQEPYLFNSSIKENLCYADLSATEEELHNACRAACIHDKILSFPDGYDSKVGARGVKLSGGEKQRLAIAQVLLKKTSRIILLDEATSSVDTETEGQVQEALEVACKGKTTFVIAHRLSTVVRAKMILVLKDGRIVERGGHAQLLRDGGVYRGLWARQSVSAELVDGTLEKEC